MPPKPKLPDIDRFRITCEVDALHMGPIIGQLTRMGLTNLNYELITDVHTFQKRTSHEVKAEDFGRDWIKDHPTFEAKELIQHFRENGRTDGSGYTALRVLCEKRELKKLGPGNYQRADVKAIAPPKKKSADGKEPAASKRKMPQHIQRVRHEVDHREFVLRYMRAHAGRGSRQKIMTYFEQHDRKASSVGGALNVLIGNKMVKALGDGEYVLLAKGGAKRPEAKPTSNDNGAKAPASTPVTTAEEAAHG